MKGDKRTRVSSTEWWLVIGALWTIDGIQALLDLFAVGLAANRFIDIFVGLSFGLYLILRQQIDRNVLIGLVVTFIGEEIPGVDVLPFWGLDGYYSMKRARAREAMEDSEEQERAQGGVVEGTRQATGFLKQAAAQKMGMKNIQNKNFAQLKNITSAVDEPKMGDLLEKRKLSEGRGPGNLKNPNTLDLRSSNIKRETK